MSTNLEHPADEHPRRLWGILLLLAGVGILFLTLYEVWDHLHKSVASPGRVQQEIQHVLDDQTAAWNRGDLESFMIGYWHSPELSFFSGGDHKHGWQETIDRYRARYQSEGKEMGKVTFNDVQIDMLAPDSAWVRGRWQVVTAKNTMGGLFTLIMKKRPEGWRIVHDHTSAAGA